MLRLYGNMEALGYRSGVISLLKCFNCWQFKYFSTILEAPDKPAKGKKFVDVKQFGN